MSYQALGREKSVGLQADHDINTLQPRSVYARRFQKATCLALGATLLWGALSGLLPSHYHPHFAESCSLEEDSTSKAIIPLSFSWDKTTPTPYIQYYPCYEDFQCARLEVPMNWQRDDAHGKKMAIAIVRLPARVPVTDPRYGGPILTNPGGPGGSGVEQVLRAGKMTQYIADSNVDPISTTFDGPDKPLYHDIISFDPRGIGLTTPSLSCFPDTLSRQTWMMQNEALGLLGSSEDSFLRNWYRSKALAEGCSAATGSAVDGSEAIGEFVGTASVARDMLEIIDRHGDWVEQQKLGAQALLNGQYRAKSQQAISARTPVNSGDPKLKYWGNSYGTLLGQTFASLFPSSVGRMILDGVVDAHSYYNGPWFENLEDSDRILESFFVHCASAGPDLCRFWHEGGAEKIKEVHEKLLLNIFRVPLGVPASSTRGPDVITWSDVKSTVRLGMYMPTIYFPVIAELLADIAYGNGSLMADFKQSEHALTCPSASCQIAGPFSPECNGPGSNSEDASIAILCSDSPGLGEIDEVGFQGYWHQLQNQSKVLGDWWAHTRLGCVGWKTKAKWRLEAPYKVDTAHPILFINPRLDPVTPIVNARAMAKNYPGSTVLEQASEGHTSWSSPSLCTAKVARAYFQSGVLPAEGTVCKPNIKPFGMRYEGNVDESETILKSDNDLNEALDVVGKSVMSLHLKLRGISRGL